MHLSVVVPTYNQAELLAQCLRSLVDQTLDTGTYEIIAVDDGSSDGTAATLAQFTPQVTAVRLPANRGRSAARNAGIARASGPIIVFIDSDVVVRPDFLEWHLHTHHRHGPRVLSRGPVVLVSEASAARRPEPPRFATSPAYLDTANAGVEKSALERAGLFDESFRGYGWEDFELGYRLRRLGVRRVFCPQAVAFHVHPPQLWEAIDRLQGKEEERAKSAAHFYSKHPTLETRLLIQATPAHQFLYWLQTGGGVLTPANVGAVTRRLRARGLDGLAYLGLRGVLNRHYLKMLASEFKRDAHAVA